MFKQTIVASITFLALLFCTAPVRAEIVAAESIEWLVFNAEVVATGHLKAVREIKGPGDVSYEDCTLVVSEWLKPSAQKQKNELTFTFRRFKHHPSAAVWMRDGAKLLVFLSTSKDHGPEKHLDGALVPTSMSFPLSLVNLAAPGKYLIDTKFNVLKDGWEVLGATHAGLLALNNYQLNKGRDQTQRLRVEVPSDSEAYRALYAGSACYLYVPNFMWQDRQAKLP